MAVLVGEVAMVEQMILLVLVDMAQVELWVEEAAMVLEAAMEVEEAPMEMEEAPTEVEEAATEVEGTMEIAAWVDMEIVILGVLAVLEAQIMAWTPLVEDDPGIHPTGKNVLSVYCLNYTFNNDANNS